MKNSATLQWRQAALDDCPVPAELNHQLIRDEGHRNNQDVAQLEQRMRGWLHSSEYSAVVFEIDDKVVAYALYRETAGEIYLRQLFVIRTLRRAGIGRQAFAILQKKIWTNTKRLTVEVLTQNEAAIAFWHAFGYQDYSLRLEIMPKA